MKAELIVDVDWSYDDALAAMRAARDDVQAGGRFRVFVGSHREEVITLGRHAPESQVLGRAALEKRGAILRRIERGGGATAHGPGQLVVYPVVHLEKLGFDIPGFTRALLDAAVDFAAEHGVAARAELDPAGVFVDDKSSTPKAGADLAEARANGGGPYKKLASIGMRVERGVVTHGLAINCVNDVSLFDTIAPCGMCGQPIASLAALSSEIRRASLFDLAHRLASHVGRRCVLAWP